MMLDTLTAQKLSKPCRQHGENPKRYRNGACAQCRTEAKARWRAKLGEDAFVNWRRQYDKKAYHRPGTKTYEYRRNFRASRKEKNPRGYLYTEVRARALKEGIEINITVEDITIPECCPVFGTPLKFTPRIRTADTPSVDRIDSTRGYIKGNIIVVSWRA